MEVGQKIKYYRKQAGLTQDQFAIKVGIHYQSVSRWERDLCMPDISQFDVITKALGIKIEDLFDFSSTNAVGGDNFSSEKMGRALKLLRTNNGLSQKTFASMFGFTSDSVSKWERGLISPPVETLVKIATHFNVALSAIYYGDINNLRSTKTDSEIVVTPKKSNKNKIFAIVAVICVVLATLVSLIVFHLLNSPAENSGKETPSTSIDNPEDPIEGGAINNTYDGTEGLAFCLLQDGTYGVEMGTTKYLEEIIIPSTYNGKAVTQILSYAFANSYATSITIPSSVTKICKHAFDGAQITTLTIPASVLYVEECIITSNNTALKNVTYEGDETIIANNWNSNWNAIYLSPIEGGVIEHEHGLPYYNETLHFYASTHSGVCILADEGTNVITSFTGTVTEINIDDLYDGPYIVVENENLKAVYHFVNAIEGLQVGDVVTTGQVLATVCGATGEDYAIGPHIRFEMFDTENESGDIALNPEDFIVFAK